MEIISRPDYEEALAATRDERMAWWRAARFGMFVHFGLYAQKGLGEWSMATENTPPEEYEELAKTFAPKPGCCREWAKLASEAGMKYMVLTTRHHEGFSLWDSKVNPYNSMNACGRDIVREFVDACHEFGLRVGFYNTMMEWHHPDSGRCAYDNEARRRFLDYTEALNTELLTNYGQVDILWYDCYWPMENWEGWDSLARNQRLRALQPGIIINNRSGLPEDFSTPEGTVTADSRDWEACMTFNGISWGYVDSEQAAPYSYSAQGILTMLQKCCADKGNLLLNIGPKPDGSVPDETVEPLRKVGEWIRANSEAVYGKMTFIPRDIYGLCGNSVTKLSAAGNYIYGWNVIWPSCGQMVLGGLMEAPLSVSLMDGTPVEFDYLPGRIFLKNLPKTPPDKICGVSLIRLEYDHIPQYVMGGSLPQLYRGKKYI